MIILFFLADLLSYSELYLREFMFLMPGLLSGEWFGVQYILSTVQVEYFTLFFDNRTKVIFLKPKHDLLSNILLSLLFLHALTAQILGERLSGLRIRVYRYGLFRPPGTFQKTSLKFQILVK